MLRSPRGSSPVRVSDLIVYAFGVHHLYVFGVHHLYMSGIHHLFVFGVHHLYMIKVHNLYVFVIPIWFITCTSFGFYF